jgi:hypothetical protein
VRHGPQKSPLCLIVDVLLRCSQPFRVIPDEDLAPRNDPLIQERGTVRAEFHRTLEVWGSIPHGSTGNSKRLAAMRAVFVFGHAGEAFRSLEIPYASE